MTTRRLGLMAIARPTFDVPYAEQVAAAARALVTELPGVEVVGIPGLALDADSLDRMLVPIRDTEVDVVIIVQASFADSTLAMEVAKANPAPVVLWAVPEIRTGGRLRLNSFCGINLAAYALRRSGKPYRYLLGDPAEPGTAGLVVDAIDAVTSAVDATSPARPPRTTESAAVDPTARATAQAVVGDLAETTVGLIGVRPVGFEPCDYEPQVLADLAGIRVDPIELPVLFETAAVGDAGARSALRSRVEPMLAGLDDLDPDAVDRSLELQLAMQRLAGEREWTAFATRCWPECFTDYGGAACTPMSLCNSSGIPGCCEADVYGSVTSVILQRLTGRPAFVADLVDFDFGDDTAVLWHCGLAPLEMAAPDPAPRATIHSNRALPLLNEFALRQGRVTLARLSQSGNQQRLVVGGGEMLARPPAFSGTSGVIRFDRPAPGVFETIMHEGLEHHYGVAYGDVRDALYALADELQIPVVSLA